MRNVLKWGGGVVIALLLFAGITGWVIYKSPQARGWIHALGWDRPVIDRVNQWQRDHAQSHTDDCLAELAQLDVDFRPAQELRGPQFCGNDAAVRVSRIGDATLKHRPQLSCSMALALARWEQTVVQPLAQHHLGQGVREILHFGTYNCRAISGLRNGLLSQHAFANAIDVSGFVLDNGRQISMLFQWPANDPGSTASDQEKAMAAFLHAVADQSCDSFDVMLSPRSGQAHKDHFHLDTGPFDKCL